MKFGLAFLAAVGALCFSLGCGKPKLQITVGSGTSTDQLVLAEILAQKIETMMPAAVVARRTGLASTAVLHQGLLVNEIDLYADSTGALAANVLREQPDKDPSIVLERVKGEFARLARVEVLGLLGYENPFVGVVRTADAVEQHLTTIEDAAKAGHNWDIAAPSETLSRPDGVTALVSGYSLKSVVPPRPMGYDEMYRMLREKHINFVIGQAADGYLTDEANFTVLKDNLGAMFPSQLCLVTRAEVLQKSPDLKQLVPALSSKLSTVLMRKLDAEVELKHRDTKSVAADFLAGRIH